VTLTCECDKTILYNPLPNNNNNNNNKEKKCTYININL